MQTEQPLVQAIRDDPDSLEPGLVYADWLEEQDDPRAELVRVQMALHGPVDSADCPPLRARERLLTNQLRGEILGPVRSLTSRVEFFHGLILPELTGEVFQKNASAIVHGSPALGVRFTKLKSRGLADCRELSSLSALSLRGNSSQTDRVALLKSVHLTGLRVLEPSDAAIRPEFAQAWCSDRWPHLTRCVLESGARIPLADMLAAPAMKRLRHLSLGYLDRDDYKAFLKAFSDPATAPALETFDPGSLFASDRDFQEFCRTVSLPSLRRLDLSEDFCTPDDLQNLLSRKRLPRLEELAVLTTNASLTPQTFAGRPPRSLTRLGIRQCRFTEDSAVALGDSPLFRQLVSLRIALGNLSRHLKAIQRSGAVAKKMQALELTGPRPTTDDISALPDLFPELETLALTCSATGLRQLAQLKLKKLRRLEVNVPLSPATVRVLQDASWFERLETLNLHEAEISGEALRILTDAVAERAPQLRVLALGRLETAEARAVADSGALRHLDFVSFPSDKLRKATVRRISQELGAAYEGHWPAAAKTLGGFIPEFFPKHPFGGIL